MKRQQTATPVKYYSINVEVDRATTWKFIGRSGPDQMYRFGNPQSGYESCMAFLVHPDSTQVSLQWTHCIDSGDLPVVMVRATCFSMMEMRPECRTITLMDDSKLKRCVQGLSPRVQRTFGLPLVRVSLAHHSIMLYGETWYQRKMNAVLVHPRNGPAELAAVREKLSAPLPRGDFDDVFWNKYMPDETNLYFEWLSEVKPTMRRLYDAAASSSDWMAYFRAVNEECGCGVFSVLEGKFARGMLGLEMSTWVWSISRATVEAYANDGSSWMRSMDVEVIDAPPTMNGGGVDAASMMSETDRYFDAVDRLRAWEESTVGMQQVFLHR